MYGKKSHLDLVLMVLIGKLMRCKGKFVIKTMWCDELFLSLYVLRLIMAQFMLRIKIYR